MRLCSEMLLLLLLLIERPNYNSKSSIEQVLSIACPSGVPRHVIKCNELIKGHIGSANVCLGPCTSYSEGTSVYVKTFLAAKVKKCHTSHTSKKAVEKSLKGSTGKNQ